MRAIFFLIVLGISISCSSEDEIKMQQPLDGDEIILQYPLDGQWNLVYVSCFCEPVDLDLGEHVWTFNVTENSLNVQNNVTEQLHTILESGTYDINILGNKITILSVEYDYYFENEKLYLANHPESDGPLLEFLRDN